MNTNIQSSGWALSVFFHIEPYVVLKTLILVSIFFSALAPKVDEMPSEGPSFKKNQGEYPRPPLTRGGHPPLELSPARDYGTRYVRAFGTS